jgi:muramidase (phage lysozyme)
MSIFRDTFTKEVKEQLAVRQNAMVNRSPQEIQYINSRNSWIRMTSAVNVNDDKGKLAKDYVLLGGTLNNGNLRSGIGTGNQAYSTVSPGGTDNKRGIRLMPGITSIDVKSKSAYGSLREVVVNFQCWDISQLEELELLYMRPGYTVLVEWGWLPYLDNSSPTPQLITRPPDFYDILTKGETERTIIFKDLFNKSKTSSGNYDAMYGYIRNYSWSARSDGGYDCQTTIISTGEIIESLKVNYINARTDTTQGLLNKEVATGKISVNPSNYYSKNILAGLWYEAYSILSDIKKYTFPSNSVLAGGIRVTGSLGITPNTEGSDTVGDDNQCYLPLGNVIDIINKYVTKDILTLSLNKNTYDDDGTDLLCISHPLQVSVDPTVCLIASPLWQGGEIITAAEQAAQSAAVSPTETTAEESFNLIVKGYEGNLVNPTDEKKLIDGFGLINSKDVYDLVNEKIKNKGDYDNLQDVLRRELGSDDGLVAKKIQTSLKTNAGINLSFKPLKNDKSPSSLDSSTITLPTPGTISIATKTIIEKSKQALDNLEFLKSLKRPYFKGDIYNEIGIIKNIYVNLNFLYKLSLNGNLESQDKKEKNEINVYNYVKNIISAIQSSLGNVNNFEIHVDPQDSIARIIDINYTGPKEKGTYESLFELEVHNLKSVVRSYTLQSQIFPEQGTIIAIGSQAKGGQLGIQNNTMIDFNRKLIDRIIPTKESASLADNNKNDENASSQLNNSLATLVKLFDGFNKVSPVDSSVKSEASVTFNDGKNALRDLIVYFQSITSSPGKNRNLIPTKFSFEMDGIGGLVIGHMFRLPKSIIPKGYRGESGIGSQLGQTITSIGHNISNNDWVTKIDALNIVLNDNTTLVPFATLNLNSILKSSLNPASNAAPVNLEQKLSSFGKVDPAVPIEARPFLDMIAFAEGTAGTGQNGYDITVGFGRISGWNETYSGDHPKIPLFIPGIGNSNAAGRYQFLDSITNPTWKTYGKNYNYTFDKKGQDLAGYNLLTIKRKGKPFLKEAYDIAKQQITNGDINVNNNKAFLNLLDIMSYEWASLPDSNGRARYSNQGGKYTPISIYKVFIEAVKKY